MRVERRSGVALGNEGWGVEVTVGPLRLRKYVHNFINALGQPWIGVRGECGASGFQVFVEIAVVEGRAAVPALGEPGSDPEVLVEMAVVGPLHYCPKAGERLVAAHHKPVGPEAVGPMDLIEADRSDAGERASTGICYAGFSRAKWGNGEKQKAESRNQNENRKTRHRKLRARRKEHVLIVSVSHE